METASIAEGDEPFEHGSVDWHNWLRWGKTFLIPTVYVVVYFGLVVMFWVMQSLQAGNVALFYYTAGGVYVLIRYLRRLREKHGVSVAQIRPWALLGSTVLVLFAVNHLIGALFPEHAAQETMYVAPAVIMLIVAVLYVLYFLIVGSQHHKNGEYDSSMKPVDAPLRK